MTDRDIITIKSIYSQILLYIIEHIHPHKLSLIIIIISVVILRAYAIFTSYTYYTLTS